MDKSLLVIHNKNNKILHKNLNEVENVLELKIENIDCTNILKRPGLFYYIGCPRVNSSLHLITVYKVENINYTTCNLVFYIGKTKNIEFGWSSTFIDIINGCKNNANARTPIILNGPYLSPVNLIPQSKEEKLHIYYLVVEVIFVFIFKIIILISKYFILDY